MYNFLDNLITMRYNKLYIALFYVIGGNMKKAIKIFLAVFLAICLVFGWLIYANWNSIEAFIHSLNTTNEDTVKELEENKQELESFLASEEDITVRDLTEEEAKALNDGTLSEEELIGILTGTPPEPEATPAPSKKPINSSPPTQTPTPTPNPDKWVSELIAKLYVQKSTYLGKLDDIEAQVINEFIVNYYSWETEQDAKKELLAKYLPTVASWEKTCDDTVYGVLNEIRAELKKQGKDDSIVDTMKASYLEEKKLKKTYFINRYMD